MDARNRQLRDWLAKVRTGEVALPRFQRFEAWSYALVESVLTAVIRDLPIGSTLVLGVGNVVPFKCRYIEGAPKSEGRPSELLLDGQQRVTALFRSLNDNYADRTYFVKLPLAEDRAIGWKGDGYTLVHKEGRFEVYEIDGHFSVERLPDRNQVMAGLKSPEEARNWIAENAPALETDEDSEPDVISEARRVKNGKRYPLWPDQPEECWKRRYIPIRLLNPDNESEFKKWAEAAAKSDPLTQLGIEHAITPLREKVAYFKLPYLYLDPVPATPKNVAIQAFIKLNTSYVKPTPFDIVVAQFEEAVGESLHDLVESLKGNVPGIATYTDPSELALASSALLQNFPPNERTYIDSLKPDQLVTDWPRLVEGAREAVDFLRAEKVPDNSRLPTEPVIAALVALWAQVPTDPDARGNARTMLRKYMWRSFFTTRYDHSVPSAILQDYRKLKDVMCSKATEADVPCFDKTSYPLPAAELLTHTTWPKRRDRLARALLLLTLRGGAEDIADGTPLTPANIQGREYHHLYPLHWFGNTEVEQQQAWRALNCILITPRTNKKISAKEPVKYLLERCDASNLGEAEIRRRLETHFVDFDSLAQGDYTKFLEATVVSRAAAIDALCDGRVWRPPSC